MFFKNADMCDKRLLYLFVFTILLSMFINVFHPYLWGPDEPRVAEVARETCINGNYITPTLCQRPFVEKPPLYFDIIALAYKINGGASPGAARLISALFGCVMLGVALWCGFFMGSLRRGIWAVALLITMPQFYRTAHWIVTDIGVGAFCALALSLFMYYEFCTEDKKNRWPLYLFYLASAGAFLTKGIIGIFHIAIVIGVFILIRRRWKLLKCAFYPPAMLMFLLPVGIWIYMFYQEGGVQYLHEHFINNIFGRFLHIRFEMPGVQFAATDVGNSSPWYFYLKRLPNMFGGAIIFLPFIIWDALRKFKLLPEKWVIYSDDFRKNSKKWQDIVLSFVLRLLNGNEKSEVSEKHKDKLIFMFLWTFLPVFLLSFSSTKEVTYILPSYVALAVMGAGWLDERISISGNMRDGILYFAAIVIPIAIASFMVAPLLTLTYIIFTSIWMGLCIPLALFSLFKMYFPRTVFIVCAIVLCGVILANTPEVMRKTGINRKCHIDLAEYVFAKVGDKKLYVFGGCETIRSSMPFYGKRHVPAIGGAEALRKVLSSGNGDFVIMISKEIKRLDKNKGMDKLIKECNIEYLPFTKLSDDYILISSPKKAGNHDDSL